MKKLVLAIAFVGMGSFVMAQTTPQQNPDKQAKKAEMQQKMMQKQNDHLAEMQKNLNLSPAQVNQIKDLQNKRMAEMKTEFQQNKGERQAKMEQMKAKREQMDNDMKQILTPDQYTKWQADRKAKMDQRKAAMKERGMKGDGKMMNKPMNTAVSETK
ncbi:protein CpxP [Chryseobacterium sp. H1D6B]|uniref:hypothetical protein n=1 Tax=Chryseobacterium sp. H1D6B TaxID=2940588 RepID=UPI0015CAB4DA|nr:hypothetical protein [Chryseobacterium sp. H1D6B]MDH6252105.1 protein CpxP [Chryseobacterium sp. H1D6B]